MNFGMPYMGSKNRIAENLISQLPPATHFYDLFGGGGSVTHCALLSGKYQYVHYNELDPLVFRGFEMFINGEFKTEKRWISREDFHRLKDTDPYVAICFSFGNNFRTYLYGTPDRERFKKAVHYSICFNDNSLLSEYRLEIEYHSEDLKERRLELQRYLTDLLKHSQLNPEILPYLVCDRTIRVATENLQGLERLNEFRGNVRNVSQNLLNLERLFEPVSGNVFLTNQSYENVSLEPDSVIYCDPPYLGTEQYRTGFDPEKFYEWLRESKSRVYISEYSMPQDFTEVFAVKKQCTLNDKGCKNTLEKLFTNKPLENPLEF